AVVALPVDVATLPAGHAVDLRPLVGPDVDVGARARLRAIEGSLTLLEAIRLASGDLAAAEARLASVLLVTRAPIDCVHRLRVRAAAEKHASRQHRIRDCSENGHRSLVKLDGGCTVLRIATPTLLQTSLEIAPLDG